MMDSNIIDHNNYSKMLLGWTKPYVVLGDGKIKLEGMSTENNLIVIPSDSYSIKENEFNPFGEYILIELYNNTGLNEQDSKVRISTDRPFAMDESGVRIYHVDNRLFYVDATNKAKIKTVDYTGENQEIDSTHKLITPMRNTRTKNQYNTYLNLDYSVVLYDEIRLIESNGIDTFSSGGYQTNKTLFKENDVFSFEKYKNFFFNEGKLDNGELFSTVVTVGNMK